MKPWVADAKDIGEFSKDDLVITPSIKRFTESDERDNMYFAVAPKGVGKTLFLKYKRHLYQVRHTRGQNQEEISFIPHDNPVDRNVGPISFSREKINILRNSENWVNLWSLCISLAIIKNLKTSYNRRGNEEHENELNILVGYLPEELHEMIENPLLVTPYGHFRKLKESPKPKLAVLTRASV